MLLEMKAFNLDNSYNSFTWSEYFMDFYVKAGSGCDAPSLDWTGFLISSMVYFKEI